MAAKRTPTKRTAKAAATKISPTPSESARDAGAADPDRSPAPAELGPRPVWEGGELRQDYFRRLRAWKLAQNPELARALGED